MRITALDHLVLTVADLDRTLRFYTEVLGMEAITFGGNRKALRFGSQKINLHLRGAEIRPHARQAACGTADLCLLTDTPPEQVVQQLQAHGIAVLEGGIVPRTGALGSIRSVYCYDPDGNLLELSSYEPAFR